jgi:putative oxidoreductase
MAPFMRQFDKEAYALMRIVAGALFLWHGTQKLFGFPKESPEAPAFVIYVAGSIVLVIGLYTRWAAFLCSGLMAAAYWMAHGTKHLFPMLNGGELAALYCFVFLCIAANGAGIWSADSARGD